MWVIKVGGSLQSNAGLPGWLRLLVEEGGGRVVIVPGGGEFADRVRATQAGLGFDDATAHGLALQAMEEYAGVLCGMEPRLVTAATLQDIQQRLATGRVPVWLPATMVGNAPEIPRNWSVTSDSLAAWLSARLDAEGLLLLKSAAPPSANEEELSAAGYVDAAFPTFRRDYKGRVEMLSADRLESMSARLADWTANPAALTG